jgi:hypothetical protein
MNNESRIMNSGIYKKYLFFVLILFGVLFLVKTSLAAPSVSSVSGTIRDGSSITVAGSNFGTKSPAIPIKWDNFSGGTNGNVLANGWAYHVADEGYSVPYYSNDSPRTGRSLLVRCEFSTKNGCVFYKSLETSNKPKVYTTFYLRVRKLNGGEPDNYKYCVFTSSPTSFAGAFPRLWFSGNAGSYYMQSASDEGGESMDCYTEKPADNVWKRVELYGIASSGGSTKDGKIYFYKQNNTDGKFEAPDHCTSGHDQMACQTRDTLHWVNAFYGIYKYLGGDHYYDFSDIYFDDTLARVEIGDNATWANCTQREIQIPSTWSDNSITLTANQGSFANGQQAYLYVVDSNGSVNASGYPVMIGSGSSDTTPPAPPSGVTII